MLREKFPKTFKSEEQNFSFREKLKSQRELFGFLGVERPHSIYTLVPDVVGEMEKRKREVMKNKPWTKRGFGSISKLFGRRIYSIILTTKPELVVETGVACGVSSSYILSALLENKRGKLISVDVEPKAGEIVDNKLRHLWELHIGKSQEILTILDINGIDVFFHDSDHSYKNMMWEFEWVYPKLKDKGLIIADDISWNNSIFDFARECNEKVFFIRTSTKRFKAGAIVKGV